MNCDNSLVKLLLVTVLCCLAASAVAAGGDDRRYIYQWTDDQGGVHISDNLEKVPEEYRSQATQVQQRAADDGGKGGQEEQPPAFSGDTGAGTEGDEGKKAAWQARMLDAKRRLQHAEEKRQQLEQRKSDLRAQWGSAGAALPSQEVMDEMSQLDADIAGAMAEVDNARDMINNVLPDEARRAGIPPGWLREVD